MIVGRRSEGLEFLEEVLWEVDSYDNPSQHWESRSIAKAVSFPPKIIMYVLDNYVSQFAENLSTAATKKDPCHHKPSVYENLGL